MKRIVLLFCTVMLFICSLCGCSASPEKNPSIKSVDIGKQAETQ